MPLFLFSYSLLLFPLPPLMIFFYVPTRYSYFTYQCLVLPQLNFAQTFAKCEKRRNERRVRHHRTVRYPPFNPTFFFFFFCLLFLNHRRAFTFRQYATTITTCTTTCHARLLIASPPQYGHAFRRVSKRSQLRAARHVRAVQSPRALLVGCNRSTLAPPQPLLNPSTP